MEGGSLGPFLIGTGTVSLTAPQFPKRHFKKSPCPHTFPPTPTAVTVGGHLSACWSSIQQESSGSRREGARRARCGRGREGGKPCPRLREAAEPGLQRVGLGPLKICANSRCSGIRQSEFFRHQPRVCGAPKCRKGAAWATFLSPESEEGETVSRDCCFCIFIGAFNCGMERGARPCAGLGTAGRGWQALAWGGCWLCPSLTEGSAAVQQAAGGSRELSQGTVPGNCPGGSRELSAGRLSRMGNGGGGRELFQGDEVPRKPTAQSLAALEGPGSGRRGGGGWWSVGSGEIGWTWGRVLVCCG